MSDDLAAVRRVLAGDCEDFRILVQRYEKPLFIFISNLLLDPHEAEDIAQEVFLTAYMQLASYDPGRAAFSTWLWTIARNKCLSALKKQRPLLLARLPDKSATGSPEAALGEAEFAVQLDAALAALPFEQKTAFVLAEIQGLSYEEIGRIEQVSLGTIKSRLNRAKEKLRALFQRAAE